MKNQRNSLLKLLLPWILFIFTLYLLYSSFLVSNTKTLGYDEFNKILTTVNDGITITEAEIIPYSTTITVNGIYEEKGELVQFKTRLPYSEEELANLIAGLNKEKAAIKTTDPSQTGVIMGILTQLLPYVLILGVSFWLLSRMTGGQGKGMDFGKSRAKLDASAKKVKFSDVAASDEEKQELIEVVDYLKNPRKFTRMGAKMPRGILLVGPPGTGKTLLGKAVAGEANVPFYSISGSDFVEMYVGVGASRVRNMFKTAKQTSPCIIFIDEIDAVGRQRGAGVGGGHDEREQTLNQLLVEMDGFSDNDGVVILAATNRADVLDPALLRPGRFDRRIRVSNPDRRGREEILKVHARNKKFNPDVNFENVARRTPGFSGAELANVLNEAAILAVRENKNIIDMHDIDEAIDRVIAGPAKKSKIMTPKERSIVAYHEAGHAIIGLKLDHANIVQKVTIIPRGDAGGYVLMTPEDDQYLMTKKQLQGEITGLLAGRVSEEIFFDEVSTGAQNDIERATKIAKSMVTQFGMSDLGPIQYDTDPNGVFLGRDYSSNKAVSGEVAYEIDQAVREIINQSMAMARNILIDNKQLVELVAKTLLEKETLTNEMIVHLVEHGYLPGENPTTNEPDESINE